MRREFALQDDASDKFWTIELQGATCITTYGRVGSKPREARKEFANPDQAERDFDRQIAAKLAKGYVEVELATLEKRGETEWTALTMTEDVFWRIVALFDWKKIGDDDAVLERAVEALATMAESDIERFEDLLAEKLHALDTEAHARGCGLDPDEYFSVDEFLYARCVVVASGRDVYEQVLARPAAMPDDLDFEAILYLASQAFERKTEREFEHVTPVSWETFSNTRGWPRRID